MFRWIDGLLSNHTLLFFAVIIVIINPSHPSLTIFRYLSEYIYQCAPTFSKTLDLQCSDVQIRDAIVAQSDVINTNYGVDVKKQMDQDNCVGE